jgi:hypothetical protein
LLTLAAFAALAFEHADIPSGTRIEYLPDQARLRTAALAPAIFRVYLPDGFSLLKKFMAHRSW